jgi:hypothetical protein
MAQAEAVDAGARGLSVEEVFTSLSQWKAYGGPASLARVHLTPRSAKACLREGVDAEVGCVCWLTRIHVSSRGARPRCMSRWNRAIFAHIPAA